jgi:hypothetical protein
MAHDAIAEQQSSTRMTTGVWTLAFMGLSGGCGSFAAAQMVWGNEGRDVEERAAVIAAYCIQYGRV